MMKIAVLVPVYNCEDFLCECLDSVLSQDSPDLQVFCLDDGSHDGSWKILERYAARMTNVHVFRQENAGVSAARNRLLDLLPDDCDAFSFVDADDFVAPGIYAKLSEALDRTGADVAECEWDGPERIIDDLSVYLLRKTAPGRWINVINKLYRKSSTGAFRFRPGLAFEEDFFYNFEINAAIRRKVLVPGRYYTYRKNPHSATGMLNLRRYFDSAAARIRLSLTVFLEAGRIPERLVADFRAELAKDLYRMCVRKNLKKNRDVRRRRELFFEAGAFLRELEVRGFEPVGLNPVQRKILKCCRNGKYGFARMLAAMT